MAAVQAPQQDCDCDIDWYQDAPWARCPECGRRWILVPLAACMLWRPEKRSERRRREREERRAARSAYVTRATPSA